MRDGFRLRGEQVSRLETFVDAAFAFAVTLLVIAVGTLPRSIADLFEALQRLPTFGLAFLLLMLFWTGHNRWSRRYGLDDGYVTCLSLALVFVTLVFVYPLRMIISGAVHFFTAGALPADMVLTSAADLQDGFLIYGLGFTTLSAILLALHRHALAAAPALQLDGVERVETRREIAVYGVMVAVGLASSACTFLVRSAGSTLLAALPGLVYMLVGLAQWPLHGHFGKLRAAAEKERVASPMGPAQGP